MATKTLLLLAILAAPLAAHAQGEPEAARPEVAKPLAGAEADIRAGRYDAAEKGVDKAAGVPGRSAYESFLIDQTRGVLAQSRGDTAGALDAFTKLLQTGRVPASQRGAIEQTVGALQFKKQDYAAAADTFARAIKEGNKDPTLPGFIAQAHYLGGDFPKAIAETRAQIALAQKAGQKPTQAQLELLLSAAQKGGDDAAYAGALEQLATLYPTPALWADLVNRIERKPGAATRYGLDLSRLKLKLGLLTTPAQFQEFAQGSTSAGYPGEADAVIKAGLAAGVLGKAETAARDKRLQDYVDTVLGPDRAGIAKARTDAADSQDGRGLVRVGYDLATQGDASGIDLIKQGIAKGKLTRPEGAQLLLASAYLALSKPADAAANFRAVQGDDVAKDIARLWLMALARPPA